MRGKRGQQNPGEQKQRTAACGRQIRVPVRDRERKPGAGDWIRLFQNKSGVPVSAVLGVCDDTLVVRLVAPQGQRSEVWLPAPPRLL